MITQELITAIVLGLVGGLIPGPVITAIFTEILQTSFRKSLRIVFTALGIETLVAIISLIIFSLANFNESTFRIISFGGAIVLLWIASSVWKIKRLDSCQRKIFSLGKLTLMILSNGVLWTYWVSICIPKAMFLKQTLAYGDFIFMALVQTGWLISTIILAFLFSRFRQILSKPHIIPVLFKVFAFIFAYFAIDMIIDSLRYFLNT